MELYELIWGRLSRDSKVAAGLTRFNGRPAVFTDEAPSDESSGWGGISNYPRIVFQVDLSANGERKCQGTLDLSVFAEIGSGSSLGFGKETVAVRNCLCNVLLTPEGGNPYCLAWNRSDGFTIEGTNICGYEMQFDILEYPSQVTTDPDPIEALNAYLKEWFPEALVLWHDRIGPEEPVTKERPVFYCRLERDTEDHSRSTFAVTWMECAVSIHVFCASSSLRWKYARAILARLAMDGEYDMLDRSPFFVTASAMSGGADYLRTGQVSISGRYGILRQTEKKKRLLGAEKEYQGG